MGNECCTERDEEEEEEKNLDKGMLLAPDLRTCYCDPSPQARKHDHWSDSQQDLLEIKRLLKNGDDHPAQQRKFPKLRNRRSLPSKTFLKSDPRPSSAVGVHWVAVEPRNGARSSKPKVSARTDEGKSCSPYSRSAIREARTENKTHGRNKRTRASHSKMEGTANKSPATSKGEAFLQYEQQHALSNSVGTIVLGLNSQGGDVDRAGLNRSLPFLEDDDSTDDSMQYDGEQDEAAWDSGGFIPSDRSNISMPGLENDEPGEDLEAWDSQELSDTESLLEGSPASITLEPGSPNPTPSQFVTAQTQPGLTQ
eukprot:gb/GEZN01009673.1/.p1 GENE.gb/GEZN01009673.1/~~gb/GEZN01009673.1/.p1  ORF type:complete len:310 (+),score=34.49 gb/GEZN01009673.1/:48-977(+)